MKLHWTQIIWRLLIVGLWVYHWIGFQFLAETVEEITKHGFSCLVWMGAILLITVLDRFDKLFEKKEEDAEQDGEL